MNVSAARLRTVRRLALAAAASHTTYPPPPVLVNNRGPFGGEVHHSHHAHGPQPASSTSGPTAMSPGSIPNRAAPEWLNVKVPQCAPVAEATAPSLRPSQRDGHGTSC